MPQCSEAHVKFVIFRVFRYSGIFVMAVSFYAGRYHNATQADRLLSSTTSFCPDSARLVCLVECDSDHTGLLLRFLST